MNTYTSKKGLPTFALSGNPDTPSTGSNLPQKEGPDSQLHPLDNVNVVFKQKENIDFVMYTYCRWTTQSHSNSKTCRIVCRLNISNRSLQCLKLSYSRPCSLCQRINGTQLRDLPWPGSFCVYLPISWLKQWVYFVSKYLCINFSQIRRLVHSYKAIFKITASLDPIVIPLYSYWMTSHWVLGIPI